MASSTNNIWVDSTFISPAADLEDVKVTIVMADADNIGSYSLPVVFSASPTSQTATNLNADYHNELTPIYGYANLNNYYYVPAIPITTSLIDMATTFDMGQPLVSGTGNTNLSYFNVTNAVNSAFDKSVAIIWGNSYNAYNSVYHYYYNDPSSSGTLNYINNYTNFSGDYGPGQIPIPLRTTAIDYNFSYYVRSPLLATADFDNFIDITFAGWSNFPFLSDIYSAVLVNCLCANFDIETITGNVLPLEYDVFSTAQSVVSVFYDLYCGHINNLVLDSDILTIDGVVRPIDHEVFSTTQDLIPTVMDIDLYSLKITNFSLPVDGYTVASGILYVDILDDVCPVSTSGTYMLVGGSEVSTYLIAITNGYRMYYDPIDDFSSLDGPTSIVVHAENTCGDWLEEIYYITPGIHIEYNNYKNSGIDFGRNKEVLVRVEAEDMASCPTLNALAWSFFSRDYVSSDLTANIVIDNYGFGSSSITSSIQPQSTAYYYGKEFNIVLEAKDFAGNSMETFILNYTIKDES